MKCPALLLTGSVTSGKSHLTSLSLHLLICKTGIIMVLEMCLKYLIHDLTPSKDPIRVTAILLNYDLLLLYFLSLPRNIVTSMKWVMSIKHQIIIPGLFLVLKCYVLMPLNVTLIKILFHFYFMPVCEVKFSIGRWKHLHQRKTEFSLIANESMVSWKLDWRPHLQELPACLEAGCKGREGGVGIESWGPRVCWFCFIQI